MPLRGRYQAGSGIEMTDDPVTKRTIITATGGGGGGEPSPEIVQALTVLAVSADGGLVSNTGIAINPATDRWPVVTYFGTPLEVGSLTAPCYFSVDGGVTARTLGTIVAGDKLYFNPTKAGTATHPVVLRAGDLVSIIAVEAAA